MVTDAMTAVVTFKADLSAVNDEIPPQQLEPVGCNRRSYPHGTLTRRQNEHIQRIKVRLRDLPTFLDSEPWCRRLTSPLTADSSQVNGEPVEPLMP